jgi:Ca-activated chloride channel family protein
MRHVTLALVSICVWLLVAAPPAHANGILVTRTGRGRPDEPSHPVTLERHSVKAKITDQVAQVQVEQVFHSRATVQLEGTYVFPLPQGAVVSDFAMSMGGRMVKGEVVEARKARAIYEGIVRRRRDPGLLEYVGQGLYRARVFPIEPGKDLTIRLSFQQVLRDDAGTLEFRYPLATDRLNGAPVASASVSVDVESSVDLKAIYSPTHRVAIERTGERRARASFEQRGRRQGRDFLLYVGRSPDAVGFSVLSHGSPAQDGTFMAVIAPQQTVPDAEQAGRDVVFALDTSGSMAGEKIEQARRALAYGVNTLGPKDRFDVLRFSTSTIAFRDHLVAATPDVRKAALAWIGGLQAVGGTDLEGALTTAVRLARGERRCSVVFLTDGRPTIGTTDAQQLLDEVRSANRHAARIFTFGVGYDLDVSLLDRLAEASRGAHDYVAPKEDIEIVTGRFFRKISHPVLTDVKVDFGPGVSDVYPRQIGDLFAGAQVVVFGRYRQAGARTITLTGSLDGTSVRHEYPASFRAGEGPGFLERLWANRKVAYLLDQIRLHGEDKELVDEVVRLATKHGIVTRYTSGLVVEDDGSVSERPQTDNDLPYDESFGRDPQGGSFAGPSAQGAIGIGGGAGGAFVGRGGSRDYGSGGGGRRGWDDKVADALRWLAAHQRADGSWSARDFDRVCDGRPAAPWEEDALRGRSTRDLNVTAQATLAFLAAGYTSRGRHPFAKVVSRAGRHLEDLQDAGGCFGPREAAGSTVAHAQATQAMVELYGMTGSPIWKGSAQRALDYLASVRHPQGVWSRDPGRTDGDLRVTSWAVSALLDAHLIDRDAARRGQGPVLGVDESFLPALRDWLARVEDSKHGGVLPSALPDHGAAATDSETAWGHRQRVRAAMAAWLWMVLGENPRTSEHVRRCASLLRGAFLDVGPWAEESYFGTLATHVMGGPPWRAWRGGLERRLDLQRSDHDYCNAKGSVDPRGPRVRANGRVGSTALFALDATVFDRFQGPMGFRTAAPSPRPGTAAQAAESQALKHRKSAATADDLPGTGRVRNVAGKTFRKDAQGRWIDTAWDGKAVPKRVVALSEAYFALTRSHAEAAPCLALGDRVVVVLDGTPYEIVPSR